MSIQRSLQTATESFQAGDFEQAARICREIAQAHPDNADVLHFLGIIYYKLGEYDASIKQMTKALQMNPHDAHAYFNLGLAHKAKGEVDEAIDSYKKAVHLDPDFAHAHYNIGTALQERGNFKEAIEHYRNALKIDRNLPGVYYNLGIISQDEGRLNEAIGYYRKTIELNPQFSDAYNNLGLCLYVSSQINEANMMYQKAIQANPRHARAHYNIANVFKDRGSFDEAIQWYQKAIQLDPGFADAWSNLGSALQETGRTDEAIAAYENTLRIDPNFPIAHANRAIILLLTGSFEEGWKEYEWRKKLKDFPNRQFSQPMWDGSDITGRTILLHAEQGYGDTIQFIRYAPLVSQRGATVIVECLQDMADILRSVVGIHQVVSRGEYLPPYDLHCPLLSLPLAFGTTLGSIPAEIPYLFPDQLLVEKWRNAVHADGASYKVGLTWSGNPQHINEQKRSFPLSVYAPLAGVEGVSLYSLQKGEAAEQAKSPPDGMKLLDFTEDIHDFSDTAAVIENLDLVISVDTAVAHLAGALGKPVWTLVPFVPDWRWLLNRDDSPWYPTMRLFRQPAIGDWNSVIARVADTLQEITGSTEGENNKITLL